MSTADPGFALGQGVATAVCRIWLRDVGGRETSDLDALFARTFNNLADRRRLARTFERMADGVADTFGPAIQAWRGSSVDRNDAVMSAARALALTRPPVDIAHVEDLDPFILERRYAAELSVGSDRQTVVQFSLRLVAEATDYVVALATSLPPFAGTRTLQRLRAEKELLALTQTVLAAVPKSTHVALDDDDFETRYRREIVRRLDQLVLFGLSVTDESTRRYPLSVAYISLNALTEGDDEQDGEEDEDQHTLLEVSNKEKDPLGSRPMVDFRVEEAVSRNPRLLLRGEAGSGKTTLLQYLAVKSGTGALHGALDALNDRVPFLIQLRRYAECSLPGPEDFLQHHHQNLHEARPPGWITDQLRTGRALVLIDGVDEVRNEARDETRAWLKDLCRRYPDARYVVTSRPPAVGADWLTDEDFKAAELQPMTLPDVDSFIAHWHDAARQDLVDPGELLELDRLQARLSATVRSSRPIRSLATSPLLCAMLCALNRDRRSQLPDDRQELYRIALETLLDRRDVERELPSSDVLGLREKLVLLGHLAYTLMGEGRADVAKPYARELIAAKLQSMPGVTRDANHVFDFLLERSGLLREPVDGRIDFVHRTFQEYLAAFEAVELDEIGFLLSVGALDEWREVIVLAAGQAHRGQRERLIAGLLDAGDADPRLLTRLHLLAVACLENSPELGPRLIARLHDALTALMPPTSMTQARAVASATDLAVPLLARHHGPHVLSTTAAACVRALALIGGDSAQAAIANFGPDRRVTVIRELMRAWGFFEPDAFAAAVLRETPFTGGLRLQSAENIPVVRHLARLRSLEVIGAASESTIDLSPIASRRDLTRLRLIRVPVHRLAPLGALRRLESLELAWCSGIEMIDAVAALSELRSLTLTRLPDLRDIRPIRALDKLRHLTVSGCPQLRDIRPAARPSLESLVLTLPPGTRTLDDLGEASALQQLTLGAPHLSDMTAVTAFPDLREIVINSAREITDLAPLGLCADLTACFLREPTKLRSLAGLGSMPQLQILQLHGAQKVEGVGALSGHSNLYWLDMTGSAIRDLNGVREMMSLDTLIVARCENLRDLTPLAGMPRLRELILAGCESVTNLEPLVACGALQYLDLDGCSGIASLEPLLRMPALSSVNLGTLDRTGAVRKELRARYVSTGSRFDPGSRLRVGRRARKGSRVLVAPV